MRTPAITGLGSGLQVAGKEVIFSFYDGFTGLATNPINGWKDGRTRKGGPAWGLTKGVGRGLGGAVSRIGAMAFGIPGYSLKGVEMQFRKQGIEVDQLAKLDPPPVPETPSKVGHEGRKMLREQWKQASAKHPVVQRRILQAFADLHEADAKQPELEEEVLRRWDALLDANDLRHRFSRA